MGRRRTAAVREDLGSIEKEYRGRPESVRIRALTLFKEDPLRTSREVARMLGVSKPTVDRWWTVYRRSGLEGVLEIGNRKVGRRPGHRSREITDALPEIQGLTGLLNRMPLSFNVTEAIDVLRTELKAMLPDVDHIVISVDTACDLLHPEQYRPDLDVVQDITAGEPATKRLTVRKLDSETSRRALLMEHFRAQGYPVDRYQPPLYFEILYAGTAPLGDLFLWREKEKTPISQRTIDIITSLLPFLTYALSNIVARQHYASPGDRLFRIAVQRLSKEGGLSIQERRVVNYRLYGYSYKLIADEMGVSEETVKKHLTSVHRKTGTSGYAELFAKYFAPLFVPGSDRAGSTKGE